MLFVELLSSMKLIINNHAIDRFEQRFKLMINKSMWNKSGFRHMINLMFKKSTRNDLRIRNQIGLYNSLCIKYNGIVEYYEYNGIVFACVRKQNRLILRTVFKTGNQL